MPAVLPIVMAAASVAQIAMGAADKGRARRLRREYDKAESKIPLQDPAEVALLDENRRLERAFMSGTDPIAGYSRQMAQNMVQQTQVNQVRAGKATMSDLMRPLGVGNQAVAQAGARSAQTGLGLRQMTGTLRQALSDREWRMKMARARRIWAESQQAKHDGGAQIMAGFAMAPDIAMGMGDPKTGRQPSRRTMTDQLNAYSKDIGAQSSEAGQWGSMDYWNEPYV